MDAERASNKRRLGSWLAVLFVFAMIMGPGPGLRFVNPDVTNPDAAYFFAGLPIIYAWGLFWFFVQLTIVLVAYRWVWADDDDVTTPTVDQ